MEVFLQTWNNMGPYRYYIFVIIGFAILGLFISKWNKDKTNNRAAQWLEQNPKASKIIFDPKSDMIHSNFMEVNSIDGAIDRVSVMEGTKHGIYLNPGTHELTMTFTTTRPGVMHKSVTKKYGPAKVEIEVGEKKNYVLSFNTKEETFVFEEMA